MFIDVFAIETKSREIYGISTDKDRGNKIMILEFLLSKIEDDSESMNHLVREYKKYNAGASFIEFTTTSIEGAQVSIIDMVSIFRGHLTPPFGAIT